MTRKIIIILLMLGHWVIINIHRAWNNLPSRELHPFPLDKSYPMSWHWYIHFILKDISILMLLLAAYIYMHSSVIIKRDKDIARMFGCMVIVYTSDIIHFLGWARHSEIVLSIQGLFILLNATLMIIRNIMKNGQANKIS